MTRPCKLANMANASPDIDAISMIHGMPGNPVQAAAAARNFMSPPPNPRLFLKAS